MDVIDDVDLLMTMVASGVVDAYEVTESDPALPVPYPETHGRHRDTLQPVRKLFGPGVSGPTPLCQGGGTARGGANHAFA